MTREERKRLNEWMIRCERLQMVGLNVHSFDPGLEGYFRGSRVSLDGAALAFVEHLILRLWQDHKIHDEEYLLEHREKRVKAQKERLLKAKRLARKVWNNKRKKLTEKARKAFKKIMPEGWMSVDNFEQTVIDFFKELEVPIMSI